MRKKKDKAQIITPSQSYFATKKKKIDESIFSFEYVYNSYIHS